MSTIKNKDLEFGNSSDEERREIMVEHLRRRVRHSGFQAALADKLAKVNNPPVYLKTSSGQRFMARPVGAHPKMTTVAPRAVKLTAC